MKFEEIVLCQNIAMRLEVQRCKPELCLCQRVACRAGDDPLLHNEMK